MTWVDLIVLAVLAFAAYTGFRRGAVTMALELASFLIATIVALLAYHGLGAHIKDLASVSTAMSNVAAFTVAWILTELACALAARLWVLPRITRGVQLSRPNRIGGSVLSILKSCVVLALLTIVLTGLPFDPATKKAISGSAFGKIFSGSGGQLGWLAGGLGRDLGESLNFFTVTSDPESTERIELGYKTTGEVDPKDEAALLVLLNKERTNRGLVALSMNEDARKVAREHSRDMFARGYFSHITPEGKNPFERMRDGGVLFGTAGENLALAPTVPLAHEGLMNSPGHRANILNAHYREVGIGIIDGGPYGLMVTQDFTD